MYCVAHGNKRKEFNKKNEAIEYIMNDIKSRGIPYKQIYNTTRDDMQVIVFQTTALDIETYIIKADKSITITQKKVLDGVATIESEKICIGDGATIFYYSDRQSCTIIDISKDGKTITVQEDKAIRTDNNGMSDCQNYVFERNDNGRIHTFKQTRKDKNKYTNNGIYKYGDYGCSLGLGFRSQYFDYSF